MNKKNILIVSFTLMIIPAIMYFVDVVPSIENEKNVINTDKISILIILEDPEITDVLFFQLNRLTI